MNSVKTIAMCSALISAGWPLELLAQTPQSSEDSLSDIIVTAQRREENIQKVGAAITALTSERLEQFRVRQPADIAPLTSGLSTFNFNGDTTPAFSVRGIGLDDFNPNNSSGTAVYIDGAYMTGPVFLSGQLYDVGRIEVLKGPQGTLYGRNATGGAIAIISAPPTNTLEGYATAGYSRYDTIDLNGAVSGPLGNGFSARVAGTMTHQGHGWQKDIDTGRQFGKTRRYAGRGQLKYENGIFNTVLNVHVSQDSSTPSSYQEDSSVDPRFDTGTTDSDKVRVGPLNMVRDESLYGVYLTTNVDLGVATLFNIIAYDHLDRINTDNNDGVPQPVVDYYQDDKVKQFYTETRLASNEPLLGRINWILGTSYSSQHYQGDDRMDFSGFFNTFFAFDPLGDYDTPGRSVSRAQFVQKPKSLGLFVHTNTTLTEGLRLVLGARYSSERVRIDGTGTAVGTDNMGFAYFGGGAGPIIAMLNETRKSHSFDYKAGLEFDVDQDIMLYASTSTATKAGLYHLGPPTDPFSWRYTKPEDITAYEVGFKSSFFNKRIIFNAAAYYYDYKNRQSSVAFFTSPFSFAVGLANLPKARIKGFEADLTVRPVEGISLSGTLSHIDSEVRENFADFAGFPLLGGPLPIGAPLSQAPRWSYSVQGTVSQPLGGGLVGKAQLTFYRSTEQNSAAGDPVGFYGPNSALDGRVTLAHESAWDLSVWGKNLTDKKDRTATNASLVGRTIFRRKPITYGIELTRRF